MSAPNNGIKIINLDSFRGGIGEVDDQHIGNVGNANNIASPLLASPFVLGAFWGDAPNPPANSSKSIVLIARSKSPANPRSLLVSLNPPEVQEIVGDVFVDIDLKALITWGVGGNLNTALVDFVQGTQITLPASHLQVEAIYAFLAGSAPNVRAGASLGYGGRSGAAAEPSFTGRFSLAAPGAGDNTTFILPNFARTLSVLTTVAQSVRIEFRSYTGGNTLGIVTQAANVVQTIPIPNGTGQVNIANLGPLANTGIVRFGLAL